VASGLTRKELDALIAHAEEVFARAMRKAMRAATEQLVAEGHLTAALTPVGGLDPEDIIRAREVWRREVPYLTNEVAAAYGHSANAAAVALYSTAPMDWVPPPPPPTGLIVAGEQMVFDVPINGDLPLVAKFAIDSNARNYLTTATNRLVGVGDASWAAIRDQLREGFIAGESIDKLQRRLREVSSMSQRRARTIARTEVVGASNHGAMVGAASLPGLEPEYKTWLATFDGRTRPSHVNADGQRVLFEEPFTVGGYKMMHPHAYGAPAEEVVNCRCTVTFSDPVGFNEEPEPEPEPEPVWQAPTPPFDVDSLEVDPHQPSLGGVHPKIVLRDPATGKTYLFKPMEGWLAHGEMVASEVAQRAGINTPRVWRVTHSRQGTGSLQEMLPNARNAFPGSPHTWDPLKVDIKDLEIIQQNRALDWMIGNHDAHAAQWIRPGYAGQGARVVGIDKGQAFKHFDNDQLSVNYHPTAGGGFPRPVYNILEEAYANNTLPDGVLLRVSSPRMKPTISRLQAIDDDEYRLMLRPYAAGRYGPGSQAAENFIERAVARKATLAKDLENYHQRLYDQRRKLRGPRPTAQAPVSGGPGGPKGFVGAVDSRNDYAWMQTNDSPFAHASNAPAARAYTGSSYHNINSGLRAGRVGDRASALDRELGSIQNDMYVNRKFRITTPPGGDMASLQGTVLFDRAFMSTSTTAEGAGTWSGPINMRLRLNRGTPASWVDNISSNRGEREVIVGRGQYVYVHKVTRGRSSSSG
jgi:hypothetical protein